MHFPTILTALAATIASAATVKYQGPQGNGAFQLQVIATGGNQKYSGGFLNSYHTGAGSNALVYSDQQKGALAYKFNTSSGTIYAKLGDYPYSFSLNGQGIYGPPKNYAFVGFNVGDSKQHFTFSQPQNYLKFGPAYAKDTFAICPAVIYSQGVYVPTLVYRAPDAAKNSSCTDVKIKAIF